MSPFDVSAIEAGDTINQAQIEAHLGIRREADQMGYQFRLMQLQGQLSDELRRAGKILTVTCRGGDLYVLTHREAAKYNPARFAAAQRKMRRAHTRLLAVNTQGFGADEVRDHEKNIVNQSRTLAAIKQSRSAIKPVAHERKTPGAVLTPRR